MVRVVLLESLRFEEGDEVLAMWISGRRTEQAWRVATAKASGESMPDVSEAYPGTHSG